MGGDNLIKIPLYLNGNYQAPVKPIIKRQLMAIGLKKSFTWICIFGASFSELINFLESASKAPSISLASSF